MNGSTVTIAIIMLMLGIVIGIIYTIYQDRQNIPNNESLPQSSNRPIIITS